MLSSADFRAILDQVIYPLNRAAPGIEGSSAFIDRVSAGDGRRVVFDIDAGLGWHAELVVLDRSPTPQMEPGELRLWVGDQLVLSVTYIGLEDPQISSYVSGHWETLFLGHSPR